VLTLVDRMLQMILLANVPDLSAGAGGIATDQVSFDAPDGTLFVGATRRLSLYLADIRENVKLRSNERPSQPGPSGTIPRRMPYRLDCHYLIAAHTPTSPGQPPLHHTLLYQATAALVRSLPLVPARILAGDPELANWAAPYRDSELPMTVNPPEGFPKLAEFWGTLPGNHPWRPAIHVIVTIPVEYPDSAPSGIVHHAITVYRQGIATEERAEIGGTVLDTAGNPVGRANVFALDAMGIVARTTSDDDGRFIFALPAQATQIYAAAFGLGTTATESLSDFVALRNYTLRFQ
jgi:hypothetical protein